MARYGLYDTYEDYLKYTDFDVYDEPEIEPEEGVVFIDGEQEEIEEKYGCRMEDMCEEDLIEIAEKETDVPGDIISAEWNPAWVGIDYKYYYEE